jgi:hypothetical protein
MADRCCEPYKVGGRCPQWPAPGMAWPISSAMAERTSEARTVTALQFKLNPRGWANPARVSHL